MLIPGKVNAEYLYMAVDPLWSTETLQYLVRYILISSMLVDIILSHLLLSIPLTRYV